MSNTITALFPDESRPQSQNCIVDISAPWNYWHPYGPQITWIGGMPAPLPTAMSTTDEPEEDDEDNDEPEEDDEDEEECLTLTMADVEAMLRRVIKEELGKLRITQGEQ